MVGHQYTDGGLVLEDGKIIARRLEEAGATALHVVAGSPAVPYWHTPPMAIPRGCHAELAGEIKKAVSIPVIAVGRINDPLLAEEILEAGKADLIAMGRALIADPALPLKAREGRFEEIRKCLACNHCRKRVIQMNRTLRCAVNAQAGRERDSRILPSPQEQKKSWWSEGDPPAWKQPGSWPCGATGWRCTKRRPKLGGQVNLAVIPPHKEELQNILDYLVSQMEKLKVRTCLGTEATADTVAKEKPEAIILAAGARPLIPEIPGLPGERLFTPEEALEQVGRWEKRS